MRKKIICATWLIVFVFVAGMAYAGEVKTGNGSGVLKSEEPLPSVKKIIPVPTPAIKKISPVPKVKYVKPSEVKLYGICIIDRIGKNEIVLEDELYDFAPATTFYSETGKPISKSKFRMGNKIGFTVNSKNEIVSVWRLK